MQPLTLSSPKRSRALLQYELNRSPEARYNHRLHCVMLVAAGLSCERTAQLFGDSPRTLSNWVRRFERKGVAGLAEGHHSGRPARLSATQLKDVRACLRRSPAAAGMVEEHWDGKNLSAFLRKRYQVKMGVRQCQRLFHPGEVKGHSHRPLAANANSRKRSEQKKTFRPGRKTRLPASA
jgi:transposase